MLATPPDRTLGVFETMLVRDGRVHALDAHLERLGDSLRELYDRAPPAGLAAELRTRAAALGGGEHRLRVDALPGPVELKVAISSSPLDPGFRRPLALTPVVVPGGLGAHKWRDRRALQTPAGAPVALLIDSGERVLEAAFANVWLLRGSRLVTPPADGRILPGITRALLLARATNLGLTVSERPVLLEDLRTADAVLLTSALRLTIAAALGSPPEEPPLLPRIRAALAAAEGEM